MLADPRLLIKKPLFLTSCRTMPRGVGFSCWLNLPACDICQLDQQSVLPCSARGMRENTAHLFSTNSRGCACFCLFHLLVAQKKKQKHTETRHPSPQKTSEEAPKPTTFSSRQWALHRPAGLFAAIHPQFGYEVTDEHPSLWTYPQELWNVAPLKAHRGTSCWLWLLEYSPPPRSPPVSHGL